VARTEDMKRALGSWWGKLKKRDRVFRRRWEHDIKMYIE
jgi:hypothetical protein